jgi:hypothetical protein
MWSVAGFPPRRPGFEPGSGHVGFVVNKVALRQVFSEYFGFPCQFAFHRLLHNHHHHLLFGAGTIAQTVTAVLSGLSLTPWEKNTIIVPSSFLITHFPSLILSLSSKYPPSMGVLPVLRFVWCPCAPFSELCSGTLSSEIKICFAFSCSGSLTPGPSVSLF